MRTLFLLLLTIPLTSIHAELLTPEETRSRLYSHNKAVHLHDQWIRDPYIYLHTDGFYYLTGTTLMSEPDEIVGIPVWRSLDLVEWEKLPRLWQFEDSSWIDLEQEVRHQTGRLLVWAPELHFIDDRWVLMHTTNNRFANILTTRSYQLQAPLEEPMGKEFGTRHDPTLFLDGTTPYLVWGITHIQQLKSDFTGFVGDPISIEPSNRRMGHEGSIIFKIGRKYVLFGTAWSTDTMRHGTYNLYYATADKLEGPYGERRFCGRFLGHGTPFQDKQGRWWCTAFYNANHPTLDGKAASTMDLSDTAYTINPVGTTIVPLKVALDASGDVWVRAKDPDYAYPGQEEVQTFDLD